MRAWPGTHDPPDGLTAVELVDQPPSHLVVAWNGDDTNPLARSFVAAALYRPDRVDNRGHNRSRPVAGRGGTT